MDDSAGVRAVEGARDCRAKSIASSSGSGPRPRRWASVSPIDEFEEPAHSRRSTQLRRRLRQRWGDSARRAVEFAPKRVHRFASMTRDSGRPSEQRCAEPRIGGPVDLAHPPAPTRLSIWDTPNHVPGSEPHEEVSVGELHARADVCMGRNERRKTTGWVAALPWINAKASTSGDGRRRQQAARR